MDLVIGIGNRLRSDDGVGREIVDRLSPRVGLNIESVHQLVPDLVEPIEQARRVLFVDADVRCRDLQLQRVRPSAVGGVGHTLGPEGLLHWAEAVGAAVPDAWLLSVPVKTVDIGEGLSDEAERAVGAALERIDEWLDEAVEGLRSEEEV